MFRLKRHTRTLSRLMAGLFALQIIVTGFCLPAAQAHTVAMPAMQNAGIAHDDSHCVKATTRQHENTGHACYHCDQPDELSNNISTSFGQVALLLPGIISTANTSAWIHTNGALSTRVPTGPPRSSTLLYTTSPRIRI